MKFILTNIFFLSFCALYGQYDHESVFPELNGDALYTALADNYRPATVLDYGDARDTFFSKIDGIDGELKCVYTGYTISLTPGEDPTTEAFEKGINTEHTYPRSKGAMEGSNAYSDMHHLFATRVNVNSDRGTLPFADIPDSSTDKWYTEDNTITSIPSSNIDAYSELKVNENFEPREDHKGDVARAYFYFYTMYRFNAEQADPDYFPSQVETLCGWHYQDPVDEKEWNRNQKIATYQDNKENPFVLDCRLARLYCDEIAENCQMVNTTDQELSVIEIHPNPTQYKLSFGNIDDKITAYSIIDLYGHTVSTDYINTEKSIDVSQLTDGFYTVIFMDAKGHLVAISRFIKA